MINERLVRTTLWLSVPFNMVAAYGLLRPASWLGSLMGMPSVVPVLYTSLLSFLIFTFGLVYGWLAASAILNKPVVALGVFGKLGVFFISLALWITGDTSGAVVAVTTGDLAFGTIWGLWLIKPS